MSFEFKWPTFSPSFYDHAKQLLCSALNKGNKPAVIADRIQVTDLDMGTMPPQLEILEIGDLGSDRFRGIFRMTYAGDASICLQTKVQANPLRQNTSSITPDIITSPSILFASTPLIVPMTLRLSCLKLRAIVVLVISRHEGVTLVFKNDPLESVQVSSTFDSLSTIQSFLQSEIERQLRELFRTELPGLIHQLSRKYLSSRQQQPSLLQPDEPQRSHFKQQHSPKIHQSPTKSFSCGTSSPLSAPSTPTPPHSQHESRLLVSSSDNVPDEVESYDPTYGLRPSHPPLIGHFKRYRSLIEKKSRLQGLGSVLSSTDDEDEGSEADRTLRPEQSIRSESLVSQGSSPPKYRPCLLPDSPTPRPKSSNICSPRGFSPGSSKGSATMAKPRIFHSNSAALLGAEDDEDEENEGQGRKSTISSLFAHDDPSLGRKKSPSFSKTNNQSLMPPIRLEGEREHEHDEGEMLRSRRMERLSVSGSQITAKSEVHERLTAKSTGMGSSRSQHQRPVLQNSLNRRSLNVSQCSRPVLARSPAYETRPNGGIYLEERWKPEMSRTTSSRSRSTQHSAIFLTTSHSASTDLDLEELSDLGEGSRGCDLLASLVRGNWTLSPICRSIEHYVSRSTPFEGRGEVDEERDRNDERRRRMKDRMRKEGRCSCLNKQIANEGETRSGLSSTIGCGRCLSIIGEERIGLDGLREYDDRQFCDGGYWDEEGIEKFQQKRIIRISGSLSSSSSSSSRTF